MKMRYLISLFVLTIGSSAFGLADRSGPMLVVLLMVKDEHKVIIPTLETLITADRKAGKEDTGEIAYILYDTGSTDGTDTMAKKFFEDHGIKHHVIVQEEFINFAASRNRALEVARDTYPDSTFILFPDAEWYLHGLDDLVSFCREKITDYETGVVPPPYYRIRMSRACYISLTPRLILTADDVEFEGVVHECPTKYSGLNVPTTVHFDLGLSKFGADKSCNRWYRDRNLLLKDLQENPSNARTVLYLGLTEKWLGHNHISYIYLKRRLDMPTFPQEDYYALYNLAELTEQLSHEDPAHYSWDEALTYYMKAYNMRPHRAEPLVRLADHYLRQDQHAVSYLFARRASELPLPAIEEEMLPVLSEDYSYYRWEILSRSAWYVEDYELGEKAAQKAIDAHPNSPHLYRNISFYWERKK